MPTQISKTNKQLNDKELENQEIILKSKPQRIVFEVTNRCNLRCKMCGQSYRKFSNLDMTMEIFKKTEAFWPTAHDVSLFGWGEPLLNPYLGDFFDIISAYKPRIFILTNGMLLTDELIDKFVRGGLAFLNFSFDGATAGTYNKIRRGSDFDAVYSNIKKVVTLKNKIKSDTPYLRMVFVAMRENIEEFPAFVELAAKIGMNEAKMVHMIAYGKQMKDEILWHHKELTNRVLDAAEKKVKDLKIKLTIPERFILDNAAEAKVTNIKHKPCPRPWEEIFVQSDGKIRLCMLCKEIMGDLNKESVADIWNNEKFQFFRKEVNAQNPPAMCSHCPQYKEMNVNDPEAFIQIEAELPGAV